MTASWFLEETKKTATWPASYQPSAPTWLSYPRLPQGPSARPHNTLRLFQLGCLQSRPRYSRDPGGPLVLKTQESSGIDTEQKAAVLQQVQAERPCCQDDFIGPLSHGELHAVVITARDRKPGKKIEKDINKDKGPACNGDTSEEGGGGSRQELQAVW